VLLLVERNVASTDVAVAVAVVVVDVVDMMMTNDSMLDSCQSREPNIISHRLFLMHVFADQIHL
jgi:hypothetical protein